MSGLYRFPLFSTLLHHVEILKYLHHFRVVERWWRSGGEKFEMLKTRKQQSMSTANRVIKNTGYLYAKMGITMFVSLYTTRLILNSLGASDFGIFNIVGGAIAMLGFLNAAMAGATQRFMSYAEGEGIKSKQKSIFNVSFVLHILISLLVGIALLVAGYFFFNGILNIPPDRIFAAQVVYGSLIISTMFTVMTVPYDAVMNAHENMLYYAIVGIIEAFLKLVVAFACVYTTSDKLIVYGILMACIPLITLTIMRVYCHKHYEECTIAPKKYFDKGLMKEMTSYAGWSFIDASTGIISQYGLGLVLNHFFGTILNAAQGIANQVAGQLMTFSQNLMKAINPVIMKNEGAGNREAMLNISVLGCKYSYLLLSFFAIPFIIEAPYILKLWLKNPPEWSILFCQMQLIRSLTEQLTLNLWASIAATGEIKNFYMRKGILNILPIFLTAILFYFSFPPYWLYITWIVCWGIATGILILYYSHKLCGLKYSSYIRKAMIPCLLNTLITLSIGIIPLSFMQSNINRLILTLFTCCIAFLFSFSLLLTKEEKSAIQFILKKIRRK